MEKYIVFGPMIIFMAFFGLLIFGFLMLVFKLVGKSKASSWVGTIIDKKFNEVRDMDRPRHIDVYYYVVVKTDEGKEMKIGLDRTTYDAYNIGDRLEKKKGELWPRKI